MLIRYGDLVASYFPREGNTSLIIRCSGMPGLPNDKDTGFETLQKSGYDVVRPDYYGFARSERLFTPSGCIQTVLDTAKTFRDGKILDVRADTEIFVSYSEIIVVGSSFGGWVACMMPKFDAFIKDIVLLFPQLACAKYGIGGFTEDTNDNFRRTLKQGYGGLVRLADEKQREEMFTDEGPYIPTLHYEHLKDVKIFMGHGTADEVIHYSRTKDFYEQLKSRNPKGNYHYAEYYGLSHGGICSNAILSGRLWNKKETLSFD